MHLEDSLLLQACLHRGSERRQDGRRLLAVELFSIDDAQRDALFDDSLAVLAAVRPTLL